MARRSVLLIVALALALVGTLAIVMYVRGIDARATAGQDLVEVLVATDTISPGETVAAAMDAGKFEKAQIRLEDVVTGALGSTTTIQDLVALSTVYPSEQIIASRFGTIGETENLVIPDKKMAISVELTDPERVAGFVNPGSEVAIFLSGELLGADGQSAPTKTQILLPRVQVIGVGTTSVNSRTTTVDGAQVTEQVPSTILTLALTQAEAQKVIYANRNGDITFALLTADSEAKNGPGVEAKDLFTAPTGG